MNCILEVWPCWAPFGQQQFQMLTAWISQTRWLKDYSSKLPVRFWPWQPIAHSVEDAEHLFSAEQYEVQFLTWLMSHWVVQTSARSLLAMERKLERQKLTHWHRIWHNVFILPSANGKAQTYKQIRENLTINTDAAKGSMLRQGRWFLHEVSQEADRGVPWL